MTINHMIHFCFILFIAFVQTRCPGFSIVGYVDKAYQFKDGKELCSVSCDTGNGYYAAQIHPKFNGTVNYNTLFHKVEGKWESAMKDTEADLNCQHGCTDHDIESYPYFIELKPITAIHSNPMRYFRAYAQCKDGYFSNNAIDIDEQEIKIMMDCSRNHSNQADTWVWAPGNVIKLECHIGCKRYGITIPAHQDAFGSKTNCKHVGRPAGSKDNLVSSCESQCDNLNGYYAPMENFLYLACGSDGEFKNYHINYVCEKACRYTNQTKRLFRHYNLTLHCKHPVSEDWYGICGVSCLEGYVMNVPGRMRKKDLTMCRRGEFSIRPVKLRCRLRCNSFPDNCTFPLRCIGENEFKERFCSFDSDKTYAKGEDMSY